MLRTILIIDDEDVFRDSLQVGLEDTGYRVYAAATGEEGLEKLNDKRVDIVLLDMRLPGKDGFEVLKAINLDHPEVTVIIMTAYGDTKSIVKAIKEGAFDYLNKPFDLDELKVCINKAFQTRYLKNEVDLFRRKQKEFPENYDIIGESPAIQKVKSKISLVAGYNNSTVLICGETGTGKELVAKAIHKQSQRKNRPFVDINCGAIPRDLLESELFGFEKSAFTGATSSKKGLLELADGGILFLDEIGEMPLELQVKLLRVLEEKKFKRIGGLDDIYVDVRILSATNKNLEEEVKRGTFREDLFYRLNVVPIYLPPLRERENDVILIANYFLRHFNRQMGKNFAGFSPEAENILRQYHWPGNVRELKNVIERIVILNDEKWITPACMPDSLKGAGKEEPGQAHPALGPEWRAELNEEDFHLEKKLQNLEKYYLKSALQKTNWNITRAAKMLGISRYSLQRRIDKYLLKDKK